jgi:hypothetical protein
MTYLRHNPVELFCFAIAAIVSIVIISSSSSSVTAIKLAHTVSGG